MLSSHLPRRSKDNDKIFVIDDLLVVLLNTSDKTAREDVMLY
jgi:hypothetical protein